MALTCDNVSMFIARLRTTLVYYVASAFPRVGAVNYAGFTHEEMGMRHERREAFDEAKKTLREKRNTRVPRFY